MSKCPKCKKRVEFSKLLWQPVEADWKCPGCGRFLRINNTRRIISTVLFIVVGIALFHPVYGLKSLTSNLFLLASPLIIVSLIIFFTQKIEIAEKDFIVRNNTSGMEQTITKEDWEEIKRNGKEDNFTLV
jgi:CXXC-20-CXXC protein